jgi:hypothetical protein
MARDYTLRLAGGRKRWQRLGAAIPLGLALSALFASRTSSPEKGAGFDLPLGPSFLSPYQSDSLPGKIFPLDSPLLFSYYTQ